MLLEEPRKTQISRPVPITLVYLNTLFHHETNISQQISRGNAYISASRCLQRERRIEPASGAIWQLDKINAKFLDFHRLRTEQRDAFVYRARDLGLLNPIRMWCVSWSENDTETGFKRAQYDTYEEARSKADELGGFPSFPAPCLAYETTPLLTNRFLHPATRGDAAKTIGVLALCELAGLDGVWFNDNTKDDSAAHAAIFYSRVGEFTRKRCTLSDACAEGRALKSKTHISLDNFSISTSQKVQRFDR